MVENILKIIYNIYMIDKDERYIIKENERLDELGIKNLKVIQNTDFFCFGIDSVLLANFVKSNSSKNIILDMCSGSGVIPILLSAKVNFDKAICVELQKEMFDLLKRNVAINNLENKLNLLNCSINDIDNIKKHIFSINNTHNIDIITVNPPYKKIGTGIENENTVKYIARHEKFCTLEDIFSSSSKLLKSKGKLYLVHKPDRLVDLLSISRKYKLEAKTIQFVNPRIDSKPSIVLIEYIKDGGNEVQVLPPIIEYDENGNYTDQILKIYNLERKV